MNKLTKRSLSFVTALMMSIMSMVTGISPSFAAEEISNLVPETSVHKDKTTDVILLAGKNGLVGSDIASTIKNYEKEYALGMASQFCVFLADYFKPWDADAEGRVAVGGNLEFQSEWDYEIGNGDYASQNVLDNLIFNKDYANAIVNGDTLSRVNPKSNKDKYYFDGENWVQLTKKFWIRDDKVDVSYKWWLEDESNGADREEYAKSTLYPGSDAFKVADYVESLKKTSEKFAKKPSDFEISYEKGEDEKGHEINIMTFTYKGDPNNPKETVYATLSEEDAVNFQNAEKIVYKNVPKLPEPRKVVSTEYTKTGSIIKEIDWEYSYIVVNIPQTSNNEDGKLHIGKPQIPGFTDEGEDEFVNVSQTWFEFDDKDPIEIGIGGSLSGDDKHNNLPGVTSLLYNIPNATDVVLSGMSFYGTVFAPKASITDEKMLDSEHKGKNPHLSGALIAQSFEGYTEFGYRPFTGPVSMIGTTAGYALALTKEDGDGKKLAGAVFELIDDSTGESVSDAETLGNEFDFITIPTSVDFSGETKYTEGDSITSVYTLREKSAPAGYEKTNDFYKILVIGTVEKTEEVPDSNDTTKILTVPTKVNVKVYRGELNNTSTDPKSMTYIRKLTYTDKYGTNKDGERIHTQRDVVINSPVDMGGNLIETANTTFTLTIEDEKITAVHEDHSGYFPAKNFDSSFDFDKNGLFKGTDNYNYYYDADNLMITRLPSKVPNFVNNPKDITLVKYVSGSKPEEYISDIEFNLFKEDGTKITLENNKTDKDGKINLGNLKPGKYYIVENDKTVDKEKYIPLSEPVYFTVNDNYTISGATYDSFDIEYTLNYADGEIITGTKTVGENASFSINDVAKTSNNVKTDHFSKSINNKDYDGFDVEQWFNASNPENYNVDFSGKKINKIVVDVDSISGDSHEIQFKTKNQWGYDDTKLQETLQEGKNEITPKNLSFESGGYLKITAWGVKIKSIEYYVDEFTYTGIDPDAVLDSITVKMPDTAKAEYVQFYNDGTYNGVKNADGTYTIEVNSPITDKWPTIGLKLKDTRMVIPDSDGKALEVRIPNEKVPEKEEHILISKIDVYGQEVKGASMTLTSSDKNFKFSSDNFEGLKEKTEVLAWESDGTPKKISNLPDGTYTLEEKTAPNGYVVATKMTFTIKDGKVDTITDIDKNDIKDEEHFESIDETDADGKVINKDVSEIKMVDDTFVKISKQDIAGNELSDAKLTLTRVSKDKDGNEIKVAFDETKVKFDNTYVKFNDDKTAITWTSQKTATEIKNLPDGKYTLEEITAPDGYSKAENVTFEIKDGKLVGDKDKVVMVDDTAISFSKQDANGTKELEGAVIEITADVEFDENVKSDSKNVVITKDKITWTSGDKETVVNNLPDGKYTMTEITAPDGYTVKKESVEFEIKDGKLVDKDKVVMNDEDAVLEISKKEVGGTEELAGAELTLTGKDNDGKDITFDIKKVSFGEKNETGKLTSTEDTTTLQWTSGEDQLTITNIPDGTYTLHEEIAPNGYLVATNITFVIENGKIISAETGESDITSENVKDNVITMFDDVKPEDKSIIISKQDVWGKEVVGAKLTLTAEDESVKFTNKNHDSIKEGESKSEITWTSGEKSEIIKNLPDGKYTLEEVTAPNGYSKAENVTFEIKDGKLVDGKDKVVMTDDTAISFSKKDANGTKELEGAVIEITAVDENGKTVKFDENVKSDSKNVEITKDKITWTSGKTETIVNNLPDGKYTMTEITAPDGYTVKKESVEFEIKDGKLVDKDKVVMNDEDAVLEISKKEVGGTEELAGAELTLTGKDNDGKDITFDIKKVSFGEKNETGKLTSTEDTTTLQWTSGEDQLTITNIPDGTYTLHEEIAPNGYLVATNITFVIENGKIISAETGESDITSENVKDNVITMFDDVKPEDKSIIISKQDVWGNEIKGAELTLTAEDESVKFTNKNHDSIKEGEETSEITWTSGEKSEIIKNLPDGKYTLEEVTAPNGYSKAENVTFEIKDGKLVGDKDKVVMVDDTAISFSKQDANGTKELEGAVIEITAVDENGKTVKFDENVKSDSKNFVKTDNKITWTSGKTETVINNLPDGKYTMTEITAPDGYTIKKESVEFEIKDGKLVDKDKVVMNDEDAVLEISKKEVGGTELSGATLTLTGKSGENDITFDITKVKTGENGELLSKENTTTLQWKSGDTSTKIMNIPDGEYTLHEVAAPNGYEVATDITFTVENGVVTKINGEKLEKSVNIVEMTDEKQDEKTISISKQDVWGEEVVGAKLTLTAEDESVKFTNKNYDSIKEGEEASEITWISGEKSEIIKNLPDGKYTLEEIMAPNGYSKAENVTFEIKDGKLVGDKDKVVMVDDTAISFSKQDANGTKELEGAVIEITADVEFDENVKSDSKNVVITKDKITWTSGKTETIVNNLPDGKYTMTEITAPDGYTIKKESVEFEIKDGKLVDKDKVVMNDEDAVLEISKKEVGGNELAGATLTLTGKSGENDITFDIAKVKTGENGELLSKENTTTLQWKSGDTSTKITNIPDGEYTLHEVAAPNGYEVATDITFTVENGVVTKINGEELAKFVNIVEMTDKKQDEKTIIISKQDVWGKEVVGAELTLTAEDKSVKFTNKNHDSIKEGEEASEITWISGEKSEIIKNLPDGKYTLEEVTAPNGYSKAENVTFEIKDGKLVGDKDKVVMVDDTAISFSKKDANGTKELEGAVIEITAVDENGKTVEFDENVKSDSKNFVRTDNKITWTSGKTETIVNNLPDGKYTMTEITAPDGYTIKKESVEFEIKDGKLVDKDKVVMNDEDAVLEISKKEVGGTEELAGAELTLTGKDNDGKDITFDIKKVSFGEKNETGKLTSTEDTTTLQWTSGEDQLTITNIPDGTYTLHEEIAPNGYLVATNITFVIENGKIISAETGESDITSENVKDNVITMFDDVKPEDKSITISKQDVWGKEVVGAELTLTAEDKSVKFTNKNHDSIKEGESKSEITWISGEKSEIIKNLPDGKYTLEEVTAPKGYSKAENVTFEIKDGKLVDGEEKVVMTDDTAISFSKQDANGTHELEGAVIEITAVDENGKTVKFDENVKSSSENFVKTDNKITWTSGKTETIVNNLPDGKYTMTEITAPDGYTIKKESVEFEIKDGKLVGKDKVVMNDEDAVLEISKKEVGGTELAGATLTLTGKSGENDITFDVTKVKTGENGELLSKENTTTLQWKSGDTSTKITNIPDGEYTLHEVAAPNGYEVATDITFTVENGKITSAKTGETNVMTENVKGNIITMFDDVSTTTKPTTTATTKPTTTTTTTTTTESTTTTMTTTTTESTTTATTTTTKSTTTTTESTTTTTTTESTTTTTTTESTTTATTTTTETTTTTTESTTTATTTTTESTTTTTESTTTATTTTTETTTTATTTTTTTESTTTTTTESTTTESTTTTTTTESTTTTTESTTTTTTTESTTTTTTTESTTTTTTTEFTTTTTTESTTTTTESTTTATTTTTESTTTTTTTESTTTTTTTESTTTTTTTESTTTTTESTTTTTTTESTTTTTTTESTTESTTTTTESTTTTTETTTTTTETTTTETTTTTTESTTTTTETTTTTTESTTTAATTTTESTTTATTTTTETTTTTTTTESTTTTTESTTTTTTTESTTTTTTTTTTETTTTTTESTTTVTTTTTETTTTTTESTTTATTTTTESTTTTTTTESTTTTTTESTTTTTTTESTTTTTTTESTTTTTTTESTTTTTTTESTTTATTTTTETTTTTTESTTTATTTTTETTTTTTETTTTTTESTTTTTTESTTTTTTTESTTTTTTTESTTTTTTETTTTTTESTTTATTTTTETTTTTTESTTTTTTTESTTTTTESTTTTTTTESTTTTTETTTTETTTTTISGDIDYGDGSNSRTTTTGEALPGEFSRTTTTATTETTTTTESTTTTTTTETTTTTTETTESTTTTTTESTTTTTTTESTTTTTETTTTETTTTTLSGDIDYGDGSNSRTTTTGEALPGEFSRTTTTTTETTTTTTETATTTTTTGSETGTTTTTTGSETGTATTTTGSETATTTTTTGSETETTTTTTDSETETTTTTTTSRTTSARTTTSRTTYSRTTSRTTTKTNNNTSSPKTGVTDMSMAILLMAIATGTAFISRSKKKDDQ